MSTKEPRYLPRYPGTGHSPGSVAWDLHNDAWKAAHNQQEGLPPEYKLNLTDPQGWRETRTVHNSSMRTAFPGQPGYSASGDEPTTVPGSTLTSGDHGRVWADNPEIESVHGLWVHGYNSSQSWLNTIGQRAYNSPRFYAAIQAHMNESRSNSYEFDRASEALVTPHTLSGEGTPMDKWNRGNMSMAMTYWKAHKAVTMGEFDQDAEGNPIPDEFEDAVRSRDLSPGQRLDPKDPANIRWRPITRGKNGPPVITKDQGLEDDPKLIEWKPDGSIRNWSL